MQNTVYRITAFKHTKKCPLRIHQCNTINRPLIPWTVKLQQTFLCRIHHPGAHFESPTVRKFGNVKRPTAATCDDDALVSKDLLLPNVSRIKELLLTCTTNRTNRMLAFDLLIYFQYNRPWCILFSPQKMVWMCVNTKDINIPRPRKE